jgi:hypothetical protein
MEDPAWRDPCFVDLLAAAEFLPPSSVVASSPPQPFAVPLALGASLLEKALPHVAQEAARAASAAIEALNFGAKLANLAPIDAPAGSWSPKVILQLLKRLVDRLRGMKEGEMVAVPAGWSAVAQSGAGEATGGGAEFSAIILALRRQTATTWDVAVCTASAGREYHPSYREPLQDEVRRAACAGTCERVRHCVRVHLARLAAASLPRPHLMMSPHVRVPMSMSMCVCHVSGLL